MMRLRSRRPHGRALLATAVAVLLTLVLLLGAATVAGPTSTGGGRPSIPAASAARAAAPAITIHLPHPTWINVTNTTPHDAPPLAVGAAAAYDPLMNATVYFGGCVGGGACPDNQTWLFAHGIWTNITDHTDAPPASEYAAMDYDANMQAILLFGGEGASGPMNDTWTFQYGVWTNVTFYSSGPSPREGASLAFDPQPEENGSVLFGGCVPAFIFDACDNDTWVWQSDAGWVDLNTSVAPEVRGWAMMAYDASDGYVVLFGGTNGVLEILDDTWELYAGQWWNVTPKASPPGSVEGGMVYVPSLNGVLLFGGFNASVVYLATTWTFSAGTWTEQAPASSPPARAEFAIALDGTGTTPIVEGGTNGTITYRDTWAYEFAPAADLGFNVSGSEVGGSVQVSVTVGGGTPPYSVAVGFGDGSSEVLTGPGPVLETTHVYDEPGTFDLTANASDAVGATFSAPVVDFTVGVGPSVQGQAYPAASDVGIPIQFESTVLVNGTLPLSYAWTFGDGEQAHTADPSHNYTTAGTYAVTLNATDKLGVVSTSRLSVVIAPRPVVAVATSPGAPGKGVETTFFGNVSGGTGPFSYTWVFGDGSSSRLPTPQHWYNSTGTYRVSLWVNDSVGGSTHVTWTISVGSSSPFWGSVSGAPAWFWGGLGAIGAAAIGGSFLLRGRRSRT